MLILTIRTDKPEAEIGLYQDIDQLAYETWSAHRQLAETIHTKLQQLLGSANKDWPDIQGIIFFQGPGSFTGLRIGAAVANALAQSLHIPIVAKTGDKWLEKGLQSLARGDDQKIVIPEYGAPVRTTSPRK